MCLYVCTYIYVHIHIHILLHPTIYTYIQGVTTVEWTLCICIYPTYMYIYFLYVYIKGGVYRRGVEEWSRSPVPYGIHIYMYV